MFFILFCASGWNIQLVLDAVQPPRQLCLHSFSRRRTFPNLRHHIYPRREVEFEWRNPHLHAYCTAQPAHNATVTSHQQHSMDCLAVDTRNQECSHDTPTSPAWSFGSYTHRSSSRLSSNRPIVHECLYEVESHSEVRLSPAEYCMWQVLSTLGSERYCPELVGKCGLCPTESICPHMLQDLSDQL